MTYKLVLCDPLFVSMTHCLVTAALNISVISLDVAQSFLKEGQHLGELVVRVHVVHGAAALLQQANDVLVLNLLVHLELLEGGTQ